MARFRSRLGSAAFIIGAACLAASATDAAQNTPLSLCDFVKKVLAAMPSEFATLKGEAQNPAVFHNEVFHGALLPSPQAECTLFVRSKLARAELPPKYSCTLASPPDFDDANRVFAKAALDLRACFPRAKFEVMYDGDGKDPNENLEWTVSAEQPGYTLELQMSNGLGLISGQLGFGTPTDKPTIAVTLDITDTLPPGKGI